MPPNVSRAWPYTCIRFQFLRTTMKSNYVTPTVSFFFSIKLWTGWYTHLSQSPSVGSRSSQVWGQLNEPLVNLWHCSSTMSAPHENAKERFIIFLVINQSHPNNLHIILRLFAFNIFKMRALKNTKDTSRCVSSDKNITRIRLKKTSVSYASLFSLPISHRLGVGWNITSRVYSVTSGVLISDETLLLVFDVLLLSV